MSTHATLPPADPEADLDVHSSLVELAAASLATLPTDVAEVAIDPALMDEPRQEIQHTILASPSPSRAADMGLYNPDVDDQSLAALAEVTDGMEHAATDQETYDQMTGYAETLDQAQHKLEHERTVAGPSNAPMIMYGPPPDSELLPPPDSPHPIKFHLDNENQFVDWLNTQKQLVKWRLVRDFAVAAKQEKDRERAREKRDKAREEKAREQGIEYVPKPIRSYKRPQNPHMPIAERERNYQCPSHGNYNPVPSEKRKRYRAPTITCGCTANVKVSSFANGTLEVNWFWKHEGHIPGQKRTEDESPQPPMAKRRASSKPKKSGPTVHISTIAGVSPSDAASAPSSKGKESEAPANTLAAIMANGSEGQAGARLDNLNRHGVPESAVRGS